MPKTNLPIDKYEYQNIEKLEKELLEMQQIEIEIKKNTKNMIKKYAVKSALYSNPEKIKELIAEFESRIKELLKDRKIKGRVMAANDIMKFIEKSERREIVQKNLSKIKKLTATKAKARVGIALSELDKNSNVLKQDIDIFMQKAKLLKLTDKQILERLTTLAEDENGVAFNFGKQVEKITIQAARREVEMARQEGYLLNGYSTEDQWEWITISKTPCQDCQLRAGKIMSYSEWEDIGTPGYADTICGENCRCELKPAEIADKEFPTVKMFDIDSDELILTTKSQENIIKNA